MKHIGTTDSPTRFFNRPRKADGAAISARWSGNSENFRCAFCGHKFVLGDIYTPVYTNDIPESGGNPLVCNACGEFDKYELDVAIENIRQKWVEMNNRFNAVKKEFWWFVKE